MGYLRWTPLVIQKSKVPSKNVIPDVLIFLLPHLSLSLLMLRSAESWLTSGMKYWRWPNPVPRTRK